MTSKIILTILFIMLIIWVISTFISMYIEDIIEKRKRKNQAKEIINRMIESNDFSQIKEVLNNGHKKENLGNIIGV